jgi:signal transduction histidine kinase
MVGTGAAALGELLKRDFAVILLDVNMPDIDGIETAELIRRHSKTAHTPIIFVTAYADEMQTARGYALGAVDYILSPIVPEILRSKVKVFVDLFRAQRRAASLARADALRAAAEETTRRSQFLAWASRELGASLDLETGMRKLLAMLVPARGELAVLAVRLGSEDVVMSRGRGETTDPFDSLTSLPKVVQRAIERALREQRPIDLRLRSSESTAWPGDLTAVRVAPLTAGDRVVGVLVLGATTAVSRDGTIEELAQRAANAFDNARLYGSLKREMARSQEAEEKLQVAGRRKDEFLAMLSHELRNPLAPIRNAAEVMRNIDSTDPRLVWARDVVERQVSHMAQLVDDLLDVSRITQGKITLQKEPVELGKVIRHGVETTRALLEAKRQRLKVNFDAPPTWVSGDFTRLAQVVGNLLNNAVKFTPEGGEVELEAIVHHGEVMLIVRDNGIGIDPAQLPHVFEPFMQAHSTLDRSQGGLGVGLTVVQRLVELHQGRVEARSDGLGHGTEFRVLLPCIGEVRPASEERGIEERPVPRAGGKRVLVVDDNIDAAETIAMLLRLDGHEVQVAVDGPKAIACLSEFAPHVAVLDIGLPGMSGYSVAARIREERGLDDVLLVALTGYGHPEDHQRSKEAGFHRHLVKPADPRELQALIADWDAGNAARAQIAKRS